MLAGRTTYRALTRTARRVPIWDMVWRAGWAFIFLVHALALRSVVDTLFGADTAVFADSLVSGVGLALGLVLCALKVLDAPILRLKPGWRSKVSASVAIALLHVGTLGPGSENDSVVLPAQVGVFLFVGTFVDAKMLRDQLVRRLLHRLSLCVRDVEHVHLDPFLRAFEAAFVPTHVAISTRVVVPRAPPFLA